MNFNLHDSSSYDYSHAYTCWIRILDMINFVYFVDLFTVYIYIYIYGTPYLYVFIFFIDTDLPE